jgi:hypothetical protein
MQPLLSEDANPDTPGVAIDVHSPAREKGTEQAGTRRRRAVLTADRLDALLWLIVPALFLLAIPIGYVSADGIGQSARFAAGSWHLNPNHLLFEPLSAWWQGLLGPGAPVAEAVDQLKRLSILAGALAVALFRGGVAARLASSRLAANHATAWFALSSAFARLWISDETHVIQMPAVVLVAILALRCLERPDLPRGLAAGGAVTLAAACFVSNLLLAPALALALFLGLPCGAARLRVACGVLAGTAVSSGLLFPAAWLLSRPSQGFLGWMTGYAGGSTERIDLAYGLQATLAGIAHAASRALYGAACALVDLAPAVAALREDRSLASVAPRLLACAAAAAVLLLAARILGRNLSAPANRWAALLTGAWLAAVLGFGFVWDNSDDQFYVQLAVVFGALAARLPLRGRRAVPAVALSGLALLWNAGDLGGRRIFYPRAERVEMLRAELGGACLVVYPGHEDLESLLTLADLEVGGVRRLALTGLATTLPLEAGMERLAEAIGSCQAAGRPVALVDLYDTPPGQNPWKFLDRLGYERSRVHAAVARFPVEEPLRALGPFTLRWIAPPVQSPR